MDDKLRNYLNKFLIDNEFCHEEVVEVEEEIPIDWSKIEEFGGKKYFKDSADDFRRYSNPMYLKEVPQDFFEKKTEKKTINKSVADDLSIDDILTIMQVVNATSNKKILDKISDLSNVHKEYKVLEFVDEKSGYINVENIESTLNFYASEGWIVKTITTNEIGINSKGIGISGVSSATNSTIDQIIVILERNKI